MSAHLTIITARHSVDSSFFELLDEFLRIDGISAHWNQEPYWKDSDMIKISVIINSKPFCEDDWVRMFRKFSNHPSVTKDDSFLEIASYPDALKLEEPFITMYIPNEMIKE